MDRRGIHELLCHATIVLAGMFLVFFCIDRVNSAMGFIDSEISKWVLLLFCLCALTSSILSVCLLRSGLRTRHRNGHAQPERRAKSGRAAGGGAEPHSQREIEEEMISK